jgi:LysR family glycine cleavage system transcriptional activator
MHYKQTPPIQWLPTFEAAARLLSFKAAAEELHVTPPAISQQINALEQWLELELFERKTRKLSLTAEGKYYYTVAEKILQTHKQGYRELQQRFKHKSLTISTPLFLAQEVLIPNYLSFNSYAPDIELRIETRTSLVDFDNEDVDAAIRFGDGNWPDLDCRKLSDCYQSIVCSPDYLADNSSIDWQDLSAHRLISLSPELIEWQRLFPIKNRDDQARIVCDSFMAALTSAAEGLGLALGIFPLTTLWVNSGKLVVVQPTLFDTNTGYWLVSPKRKEQPSAIDGLYQWATELFNQLPPITETLKVTKVPTLP